MSKQIRNKEMKPTIMHYGKNNFALCGIVSRQTTRFKISFNSWPKPCKKCKAILEAKSKPLSGIKVINVTEKTPSKTANQMYGHRETYSYGQLKQGFHKPNN